MVVTNDIFTAEPPRTQRNNFLFVGRYRQTKKVLLYYYIIPNDSDQNLLIRAKALSYNSITCCNSALQG